MLLISVGSASADAFTVDNISYQTYQETLTETVAVVNGFDTDPGVVDLVIPATVTYNDKEYDVVRIASHAFEECTNLKSVQLSSPMKQINLCAFAGCTELTSVTLPATLTNIAQYAFKGCTSLTSVTIPSGVVNKQAFIDCTGLIELTFGNLVESFEPDSFEGCTSLATINFGNSLTTIGERSFAFFENLATINFGNALTTIGDGAFQGCSSLMSVTLPNSVNEMGAEVFSGCWGLTSVTLSNALPGIPASTFEYCTSLKEITIPEPLASIGYAAFENCSGLTSVNIPGTVTEISDRAFFGCSGLKSITFPDGIDRVSNFCFYDCSSLASVTLPNTITEIGSSAFAYCTRLSEPTIPSSVKTISNYAFGGCSSIEVLHIPEGVTEIGQSAFYGCSSLWSLFLPASLTTVGYGAFENCTSLSRVNIYDLEAWFNIDFDVDPSWGISGCSANPLINGCYMCIVTNDGDEWIEDLVIPASVTKIKPCQFINCKYLYSVTFHEGITEIGDYAFYGCADLGGRGDRLSFPESLTDIGEYAFYGCKKITGELAIPNNVTTIGQSAFYNCAGFTSLTLGKSVNAIGTNAFNGASKIYTVYNFSDLTLTRWSTDNGYAAKYAQYVYNNLAERQGDFLFEKNEDDLALRLYAGADTDIVVPASVNEKSVTGISDECFLDNTSMLSITFPNTLTSIGASSFSGCTGLTSVTLPNSLKTIGDNAFSGCANMTDIYLPESITSIDWGAFMSCTSLKEVVLPNTLTTLGALAFAYDTALEDIKFGSGLELIDQHTFDGCSSLTEIIFPRNIHTIVSNAFTGCTGLTTLNIGCGITSIGSFAFKDIKFTSVSVAAPTAPAMGSEGFSVDFGTPLYVPAGSEESYQGTPRSQPWIEAGFDIRTLTHITSVTVSGVEELDNVPVDTPIALSTSIEPANASLPYIFWRSTNPDMATVDANGNVVIKSNITNATLHKAPSTQECQIIAETLYADAPEAVITLKGDLVTGIETIYADPTFGSGANGCPNDIYNLQGVLLKRNATQADIDALSSGLYIIGAKKVFVK